MAITPFISSLHCHVVHTRKPYTLLPPSQSPISRIRPFRPPAHVASPKILKKFVLLCTRASSSPSSDGDDDDKDAVLKEIIPSNSVLPSSSPSSPSSDELVDCNKDRSFVETYGRLFSTLNEASLQHEPGKEVSENVRERERENHFSLPKWKNKMEKIKQTETRDKPLKKRVNNRNEQENKMQKRM